MRRPLRLPLLALIVLAAPAFSACGGSGGSDADTSALLRDTFGTKKPVSSGRLKLGIDVRADGIAGIPSPLTARLGGPFQRVTGGGTPKFDFDITLATRDGRFTIGIISTGREGWMKIGQRAFAVPAEQFRGLAPKGGGTDGGGPADFGTLGIDPRGWITNVENEGVETLEGAKVVHLSADVDIQGLAKDLDKLLASAGGTGLNAIAGLPTGTGKGSESAVAKAVKGASVDIWTGESDHRLRRITLELNVETPGEKDGTVKLDLAVAGLNEPQPIGPPANPRPLSELSAALAVLAKQRAQQGGSGGSGAGAGAPAPGASGQTYDACVQAAGSDLAKAQDCAELLN